MSAKIIFVAENNACREDARPVQQALSELAIAFSHSFTMREVAYHPEDNLQDFSTGLLDADAVLLLGSADFSAKLALSLGGFAGHVLLNIKDGRKELGRLKNEAAPSLELVWPLENKPVAVGKAAVSVCALAKKSGKSARYVRSLDTGFWQDSLNQAAKYSAIPPPNGVSMKELLTEILGSAQPGPVTMASSGNAGVLDVLLNYLGGSELLRHIEYLSDDRPVYAAVSGGHHRLSLFSVLYAAADAVRGALKLEREAGCLETAIDNVISSGWRTMDFGLSEKTVAGEEIIRLIAEQIQLAGQLYERFG